MSLLMTDKEKDYAAKKAEEAYKQAIKTDSLYNDDGDMYSSVPADFFMQGYEIGYNRGRKHNKKAQRFTADDVLAILRFWDEEMEKEYRRVNFTEESPNMKQAAVNAIKLWKYHYGKN